MRLQVLPIFSLNGHSNVILVFHQLKLGKLPTPIIGEKKQTSYFLILGMKQQTVT